MEKTKDESLYTFSHDLVQPNLYSRIEGWPLVLASLPNNKQSDESKHSTRKEIDITQSTTKDLYVCANHFFLCQKRDFYEL
jgi:hypothetical protein